MVVAVFDPMDRIWHLKVPLFILVCGLGLLYAAVKMGRVPLSASLALYVLAFALVIPLLSMCVYILRDCNGVEYAGFDYLKAYLFLVLSAIFALAEIDAARSLCAILTILSILLIGVLLVAGTNPALAGVLWGFGDTFGVGSFSQRSYGDFQMTGVYFNSSPLLVLPIAYFTYRSFATKGWSLVVSTAVLGINIIAMMMSGTRNNMFAGCLTMFLTAVWYSKRKLPLILTGAILSIAIVGIEWNAIREMVSATEGSNEIKLQHLHDYAQLLAEPMTLLIGQGLGAYFKSTAYGSTSVTELTYFEILRFYGLMLSVPLLCLLAYPITRLTRSDHRQSHYLYIGYGGYLWLCIANPFLMSSTGMLILSVVIYRAFCPSVARDSSANRPSRGPGAAHPRYVV
jgi:hypothetical protein